MTRRKRVYVWLLYTLCALLFAILQAALFTRIRVWGVHPFVLPCVGAVIATYEDRRDSVAFAFFLGFFCDLVIPGIIPCLYMLTFTLGAVCAERGRSWILCDEGDAAIGSQILRMAGKNAFFLVERPVLPYEVRPVARAQVEVKGQIKGQTDDTADTTEAVFLRSYQPDLTQIQEADRQIVTEYISESSLDLISFWSLDEEYDGREHRADRLLPPEKVAKLSQSGEAHWSREKTISVVGYDIFGGRFTWTPQEG